MKNLIKKIRYLLEALIVWLALKFFWILGEKNASNFGSFLAKFIGKRHYSHELAKNNMKNALPDLSEDEIEKNLDGMWDNLGRIVGEYPHIAAQNPEKLVEKYVHFSEESLKNIESIKNNEKNGGLIFSAHIGNWEIGPKCFIEKGFDVATVYRPLNNPYVENMTAKIRGTKLIAKSQKGGREIIEAVKNGKYVIILADQKVSEGEEIEFFHDKAMTATSLARIALKYGVDLIPARSIRRKNGFEVEILKPVEFEKTDNLNQDVANLTRKINIYLENWIKEHPDQWFWVHDRWKK